MNFLEAVQKLANGKAKGIYRNNWNRTVYYPRKDIQNHDIWITFKKSDILATDWEVVE